MKVRDMLPAMFVHVLYSCFCRTIKVTLIEQSAIHFSLAQRSYHWSAGEGVREVVGLSVSETPWSRRIEAICEGKKRKEDGSYE